MPFDPTWPPSHAHASSAKFREQFNGLNDKIDALPAGPPGPQGIPGNDGGPGPQGIQGNDGPAGPPAFPHTGDAEISGNITSGGSVYLQGRLGFNLSDPGGSGETGLSFNPVNNGPGPVPTFIFRHIGTTQYQFGMDLAGIGDGMGAPTAQNGDLLALDGMTGNYRPTRGVTQNVVLGDGNGGFISLQITGGLITGVV